MKTYGLGKSHKLCSATAIERLFDGRAASLHSALAYPIRAVWALQAPDDPRPATEALQFFISIPKKRIRHAVDRVTMRRRIREQYRLLRPAMVPSKEDAGQPTLHVAFIYVGSALEPTPRIRKALMRLLPVIVSSAQNS